MGSYRQYPEAWFYTQIINTDSLSHQLVIDEFKHIRCDAFEVVTIKDGTTKNWGKITRSTPFSDYQIPFLTYAISIPAKDTLKSFDTYPTWLWQPSSKSRHFIL